MTNIVFNRKAPVANDNKKLTPYWQSLLQYFYDMTGKSTSQTRFLGNQVNNDQDLSITTTDDIYFNGVKFPKTYQANKVLYVVSTTEIGYGDSSTIQGLFLTGEVIYAILNSTPAGWLLLNDGTIGNAASLATNRANADTETLFEQLWTLTSNSYCPVSGGRGASAAADFAASKTLQLPRCCGRTLGNQGAGSGLSARAIGEYVGEETHQLSSDESTYHQHLVRYIQLATYTYPSSGPFSFFDESYLSGDGRPNISTTGSTGGNDGHPNMQPTGFITGYIKL